VAYSLLIVRRILLTTAIFIALLAALSLAWIFGGRHLSLFLDRFGTIESTGMPVKTIVYEGSGTGGFLRINDLVLTLNQSDSKVPEIKLGIIKDGQLTLSFDGKLFVFDTVREMDNPSISVRHSALSWPTPFDFNFMTGHSPSWKRHAYYRLRWKKQDGSELRMAWRYEQYFYPGNGWASGFMTHEGSTGLIRVDLEN